MLMNTMEALGAGQALYPKGEAPGLNLGADSETLALFASLFAMMQTPRPSSVDIFETSADSQAPQMQPRSEDSKPLLPAAAMLMAGLAPSTEIDDKTILPGEAGTSEGDAAALLKLLLTAHEIAAPNDQPVAPTTVSDDSADATAPARAATEMLTGAIEILRALEAAPELQAPNMASSTDDLPKEPALLVIAPSSPEFVGPMPGVTRTGPMPPYIIMAYAGADFIGPMPMVPLSTSSTVTYTKMPSPLMVLQAQPEFIGPMPAVATQKTSSAPAVMVPADPDFIGPLPAVATRVPTPLQQTIAADSPGVMLHNAGTNTAPILVASLTQSSVSPNDLPREAEQMLKSGLPEAGPSVDSANKDEGFVRRRAHMFTAGKGITENTAEQKSAADIQATRMAAMRAGADTLQASATSTLSSGPAQQMAASLGSSKPSAINGQDIAQTTANTALNTAGGQNSTSFGGHSGGQPGGQQAAKQMLDGGVSRGLADRTLLHRLNTDNAGWSETMVKRLTADLRSGVQNVRIILEPRQLGRLNVELGLRNDKASIRIAAETQEAAKLLSATRGQLGQMLESAGLRLAGFQATGAQADNTGLDSGQGSQGRGGDAAGDHDSRNNAGRNQELSNKIETAVDKTSDHMMTDDDALREGETAVLSILA